MKPSRVALVGLAAALPTVCALFACGSSNGSPTSGGDDASAAGDDSGFDAGSLPGFDGHAPDGSPSDANVDVWDGYDGFTCDTSQTPMQAACVVSDTLGVFVAPAPVGSDANPGSQAMPVADLQTALSKAVSLGKHRIYVCAATYDKALAVDGLSVTEDISVFGGLACPSAPDAGTSATAWSYTGAPTIVAPVVSGPALSVTGFAHALLLEDITLKAADASGIDADGNGASSIGAWVANSPNVTFTRTAIYGGAGAAAPAAAAPTENHTANLLGGSAPTNQTVGGVAVTCTCGDGTQSVGGAGGTYGATNQNGAAGSSTPAAAAMTPNIDGAGGTPVANNPCIPPDRGAAGAAGSPGAGATTTGTLGMSGWSSVAGQVGGDGAPGQGGGGGAASQPYQQGGGGGSCGGCGGGGGGAGRGGGASIALAIVSSGVTLVSAPLFTSNGGTGGTGGTGEAGQAGASSTEMIAKCQGATGGFGAGGGGGGGGAGGSVFGVAWTGATAALTIDGTAITGDVATATYFTAGAVGAAGSGGGGGAAAPGGSAPFVGYAGTAGATGVAGIVSAVKKF